MKNIHIRVEKIVKRDNVYNGIRTIFPPRKISPRLGLGFGSRLGLVLGLGDNQTIAPKGNSPPVRVRVWVRVSLGVGGQFSLGAIFLAPYTIPELATSQHLNIN